MPTFQITAPDGRKFKVTGDNAEGAMNALRKTLGGTASQREASQQAAMPKAPLFTAADFGNGQPIVTDAMRQEAGQHFAAQHPAASKAATFLQGVPFAGQYMDEALGNIAPWIGPNAPEDATAAIRAMQSRTAEHSPKTALALRIGGGIVGAAPMIAALPAGLTSMAPASLGGRVLAGAGAGAGLGAVEGAVSGYGAGTDDASRADEAQHGAIVGGLLGGGLGMAAPIIGAGVKAGYRSLADHFRMGGAMKRTGLSRPAIETMGDALNADDTIQGEASRRIAAAGPDAMLADAGPNTAGLLDTLIQRGGSGATIARQNVEQRLARAGQNIQQGLDNALGAPQGLHTTETALRTGTAPARQAAYDTAYSWAIDYSGQAGRNLESLIRRVPADVLNRANRLMALEGTESGQILARQGKHGVTFGKLPDVRQLDYISRALNDAALAGDGAGALGGQTGLGRAYQNLARDLRSTLKGLVPEYAKALDTAAEPIAARNALRLGQSALSPTTARDEVADAVKGMTAAELSHVRQGVRSQIDETLANVRRTLAEGNGASREAVAALKVFSSRANRDKLATVLGEKEASKLLSQIDEAATAFGLKARIADNSKTFARTALNDRLNETTDTGIRNTLASGEVTGIPKRAWQWIWGATPRAKRLARDKITEQIASALTGARGAGATGLLGDIANMGPLLSSNAQQAARIGGLLGYGPVLPAYELGRGLLGGR